MIDGSKDYLKDPEKMQQLLDKLQKFIKKGGLKNVKDDLITLVSLVRDVITQRYTDYEMKNLLIIIGGLIYIVTPIDAIPDFIPIGGWTDDVFVVGWIINSVSSELTRYKASKNRLNP